MVNLFLAEHGVNMCGIVGVAGKLELKTENAFSDMLIMDQLRGKDSVGVCSVAGTDPPTIIKSLMAPLDFVSHIDYKAAVTKKSNRVLIGHNRAATVGTVNAKNAHPFEQGKIFGCHNGTLVNQHLLLDAKNFDVDSENIMHHINVKGVDDMYSNMHGAAALVWWNSEEQTLHFLRNNQRPLYYAISEDKKVLFWASEYYMMIAAAHRQGIKLQQPELFKDNILHTVNLPYAINFSNDIVIEKRELKPYEVTGWSAWNNGGKGNVRRHGGPEWLKEGHRINFMFEEKRTSTMPGTDFIYEGWCPADDRVNVMTRSFTDNPLNIDLEKDKHTLYTGIIEFVYASWKGGYQEWDVRVSEVEDFQSYKKRKEEEVSTLGPDIRDCAMCFVDDKEVCEKCKPLWKTLDGKWRIDKKGHAVCGWCGLELRSHGSVFISHDNQIAICPDCYGTMLEYAEHETYAEMQDMMRLELN